MSDYVTVEVKGLSELQDKMEKLPEKLSRRFLRKALRAGGALFKAAMQRLAPRDTGFLDEHFGVRLSMIKGELAGSAFIGPQGKIDYPKYASGAYRIKRDKEGRAHKVGRIAVATVARFLEFGTSKMAPRPFMTQAFESEKNKALEAVASVLTEELNNVD